MGDRRHRGSANEDDNHSLDTTYIDWEEALGISEDAFEDDIKGIDESKLSSRLHKTEEEVNKFTIPDGLDEVKRVLLLLKGGQPIQQIAAINIAADLIKVQKSEMLSQFVPALMDLMLGQRVEFQVLACQTFSEWMQEKLLPVSLVDRLVTLLQDLVSNRNEVVASNAADALISAVEHMSPSLIETEVLKRAISDSSLSQPVPLRIWSCRLYGAAATRIDRDRALTIFKRAAPLCQDIDYEVRACMCEQLAVFAKIIRLNLVMNEFEELLNDDELVVRESALISLGQIYDVMDETSKLNIIIPAWKRLCEERSQRLMPIISRDLGKFLFFQKDVISEADMKYFMNFYYLLSVSNSLEERCLCAYNFPAITQCIGVTDFESFKLDQIIVQLVYDADPEVREILSAGLHEVAKILGPSSYRFLRSIFLKIIGDDDIKVFDKLLPNMDVIFRCFLMDNTVRVGSPFVDELLFVLLKKERECMAAPKFPWRTYHKLIEQFKFFTEFFESNLLQEQCVPLLFKLLTENITIPIKKTIVDIIGIYLVHMRLQEQRQIIIRNIFELKLQSNYHHRLIFVWFLERIFSDFSLKFMRETFFESYLDLSHDLVANIRLGFIRMAPKFHKVFARHSNIPKSFSGSVTVEPRNQLHKSTAVLHGNLLAPSVLVDSLVMLAGDKDREVSGCAQEELANLGIISALRNRPEDEPPTLTDNEIEEDRRRERREDQQLADETSSEEFGSSQGSGYHGKIDKRMSTLRAKTSFSMAIGVNSGTGAQQQSLAVRRKVSMTGPALHKSLSLTSDNRLPLPQPPLNPSTASLTRTIRAGVQPTSQNKMTQGPSGSGPYIQPQTQQQQQQLQTGDMGSRLPGSNAAGGDSFAKMAKRIKSAGPIPSSSTRGRTSVSAAVAPSGGLKAVSNPKDHQRSLEKDLNAIELAESGSGGAGVGNTSPHPPSGTPIYRAAGVRSRPSGSQPQQQTSAISGSMGSISSEATSPLLSRSPPDRTSLSAFISSSGPGSNPFKRTSQTAGSVGSGGSGEYTTTTTTTTSSSSGSILQSTSASGRGVISGRTGAKALPPLHPPSFSTSATSRFV